MEVQYYNHRHTFELLPSLSISRMAYKEFYQYILTLSWGTMTIEMSF